MRFGYNLIEDKIKSINEEIVEDVLDILNVYTAKINEMRKYKNKLMKKT